MSAYSRMSAIADRIHALRVENALAYVRSTQHLTGLPVTGECFHLAHNWGISCTDPAARRAFRHIKYLEGRLWAASRIVETWYSRKCAESYNATGCHFSSYELLHR